MKKIILSAVVAFASLTANAQLWVGGSLGFNYQNLDTPVGDLKTTSFSIAPELGYTLNDNWDIAIALEESFISNKDGESANKFVVNPYARYTFAKTGKVGFFVDLGASIGVQSNDIEYSGDADHVIAGVEKSDDNTTEWGIGIRPGIKYAASDRVTLVASLGGLGFRQLKQGDWKLSDVGFNVNGNALKFGVYYSF